MELPSHLLLSNIMTSKLAIRIMGKGYANMVFIRDGTKLAIYSPHFALRTWDIADLTDEHSHSAHGYELILQGMRVGWAMGRDNKPLFLVPVEHRKNMYVPPLGAIFGILQKKATSVDLFGSRLSRKWTEFIDR